MSADRRPRGHTPDDDRWLARHWSLTQDVPPVPVAPVRDRMPWWEVILWVWLVVCALPCLAAIGMLIMAAHP